MSYIVVKCIHVDLHEVWLVLLGLNTQVFLEMYNVQVVKVTLLYVVTQQLQ